MADNLIFPIGFDLEETVKKRGQQWDKTYAKKLETYLAKCILSHPLPAQACVATLATHDTPFRLPT